MKLGDIEDCAGCPLSDECRGMTCYGGDPIEPPCTSWDPEEEIEDFYDDVQAERLAHEEEIERQWQEEKERKRKNEIKQQRRKESAWHVYAETQKIKSLRKQYESVCYIQGLANAFAMTNEMFGVEDKKPEQVKSKSQLEKERILKEIDNLKAVKKEKLKELAKSRKAKEQSHV